MCSYMYVAPASYIPISYLDPRMYIHRVSSRHWPSPLTDLLRGSRKACRRQGDKLANGEEPKEARRGCAIAITTAIIWGAPDSL